MKIKFRKLAALLLTGILLAGCGAGKKDDTDLGKTEQDNSGQAADSMEKEDAGQEEDQADKDKTEETSEQSETAGKDGKEELQIELPDDGELMADYTSVDGLILEKGSRIAFVVKNTETGYWRAVKKGIDQAVNDLNQTLGYEGDDRIQYTFEGPKNEVDVDGQVNILDAVLAENPDVLCLAAVDMSSCGAQLEAAQENGIPVIILDSGVKNNDLIYSVCSTNNYAAGEEAARRLCEKISDQGQVAVLAHLQLGESSQARVNGFVDEINENHPDVEIVNVSYEPAKKDDPSIEDQMKETLELYPELKGYFCTNEVMSNVALEVLKAHEEQEIQLVGFDVGKTQAEAVRNGTEAGVVCQNPYGMGYATVVAGVRAVLDMENDEFIDAGYQWLDQDTIDLEENAKYLYE